MEQINYDLEATIFNIQKYSVNDGPGIRTVVFFKGCPLRCRWCSNPESQSLKPQVLWSRHKCTTCQTCLNICPKKAISIVDGHICINHEICDACGSCVNNCPNNALEIKGKRMSVREVLDVVLQDKLFYEEGGGGMTLSGGEFLIQNQFAIELLKAAKAEGIHTCCETSAYAKTDVFQNVAQYLDLMIIDVKHYDTKKHQEKTAAANNLPHDNLKWAINNQIKVLPRIPIIPNFNNGLEDAKNFIPYLKEIGVTEIQLLPFHQFGENKYKLLNVHYEYEDLPNMHPEDLTEYLAILNDGGIKAYL